MDERRIQRKPRKAANKYIGNQAELRTIQHKRLVPYGAHSNFCFIKTSFVLGMLSAIAAKKGK